MSRQARSPPLGGVYDEQGVQVTEFGGWEMPVEFDGIREEHEAVREEAGKFDVSHMGEIELSGPDAARLLGRLTTNDPSALDPGEAQYAAITDEEGVMLDDTVIYRLPEGETPRGTDAEYLFIPNAGHDEEMEDRWKDHRDEWGLDADVKNATDEYAMFAIQGPDAADLVRGVAGRDVTDLSRFDATYTEISGARALAARTGYTGEDGFEFVLPWDAAEEVWDAFDCQPCGLGARDTLRLEAGFLLSGQDFEPEENPRTPYEANIGFAVKLDHEFVGRDELERQKEEGVEEKLVGLRLLDRGIPRAGYAIETSEGEEVGTVTSGTMSPTLNEPIGLGYVPVEHAKPDTRLRVVVRGERKRARIEALPFVE